MTAAIDLIDCNFFSTEYIVDLMGAPGILIPSDISGSQFQDSNDSRLNNDAIEESVAELCLALEQINRDDVEGSSSDHCSDLMLATSHLEDLSQTDNSFKQNVLSKSGQFNVPGVVDSEFAQNLHELLLEGGALLQTDLLSGQGNFHGNKEIGIPTSEGKENAGWLLVAQTSPNLPSGLVAKDSLSQLGSTGAVTALSCYQNIPFAPYENLQHPEEDKEERIRDLDLHYHATSAISNADERIGKDSLVNMSGSRNGNLDKFGWSCTKTISSVMDDVAEYEIPWDDLDIGDRIGLGIIRSRSVRHLHVIMKKFFVILIGK